MYYTQSLIISQNTNHSHLFKRVIFLIISSIFDYQMAIFDNVYQSISELHIWWIKSNINKLVLYGSKMSCLLGSPVPSKVFRPRHLLAFVQTTDEVRDAKPKLLAGCRPSSYGPKEDMSVVLVWKYTCIAYDSYCIYVIHMYTVYIYIQYIT